jgi:hypothetical protein
LFIRETQTVLQKSGMINKEQIISHNTYSSVSGVWILFETHSRQNVEQYWEILCFPNMKRKHRKYTNCLLFIQEK